MDPLLKKMIDNMPEKTGKSLTEWKALLQTKAFDKHMEAVNFLKKEHGVTHGFANTIVSLSKEKEDNPIEKQYEGKEQLLPIYDALVAYCKSLGDEVTIVPKKTTVSIVRKKQFALIKPVTKTRIDLGLKIKDKPTSGRLEGSGSFGTMCTHCVKLTDLSQVDDELKAWLSEAFSKAS